MPRGRYPSDEARKKQRPHVKVHLSWPFHPRFAWVYADRDLRAVVLGVWMVAARAHASATGGRVTLGTAAIAEATACDNPSSALRLLRRACVAMEWTLDKNGSVHVCNVRNFAKKQGFSSADGGAPTQTPHPSEEPKNRRTDSEEPSTKEPKKNGAARRPAATPAPEELSPAQLEQITKYFAKVSPGWALPRLPALIENALIYYAGTGARYVNWEKAVTNNILSRENGRRERAGEPLIPTLAQVRDREKRAAEQPAQQPELSS